jgi:hypothetical protein
MASLFHLLLVLVLYLLNTGSADEGLLVISPLGSHGPVDAFAYWSGPRSFNFTNLSISVISGNDIKHACRADSLRANAKAADALWINGAIDSCYPETVAQAADQAGYKLVITVNSRKLRGTRPIYLWATNSAPIPIVEIPEIKEINAVDHDKVRVSVTPSVNPYSDFEVHASLIPIGALSLILSIWKIGLCVSRIKGRIPIRYGGKCGLFANASQYIILFESISGLACILHQAVDPWGLSHILPYPAVRVLAVIAETPPSISIFILGFVLQDAIKELREQNLENYDLESESPRRKSWEKRVWIEFIVGSILLAIICVSDLISLVYDLGRWDSLISSSIVTSLMYIVYAMFASFYFIYSKIRIIRIFSEVPIQKINRRFARDVEDMANCLSLSAYCLIGYVIAMIAYESLNFNRQFPFIAFSVAVALSIGSGILHVSAIRRHDSSLPGHQSTREIFTTRKSEDLMRSQAEEETGLIKKHKRSSL